MALHGIDIASWQSDMDVRNMTADFVIIKATGGTGYVNPYCDKHFQQAKQAGKLLGVYHYANEVGYEGTAKQEADFFVKNAKNYLKGDAIPVLDWEASNKGNVQWALDWLNEVERQTGIKPWFYTYTAVLDSYNFTRIADNDNALWVANYGANKRSNGYNKNATPPSTRGFKNGAACFQYSSNTVIPGYGAPIDVDIFYGDKKAWNAYATPSGEKPPKNDDKPNEEPSKPRQIKVDGQWGSDCTKRLQEYFGTKPVDGIISGQTKTSANANVYAAQWGTGGSNVIRAIQKQLGLAQDGNLGSGTVRGMQKHYGTTQDGIISPVSNMVKEMQKALNKGKF